MGFTLSDKEAQLLQAACKTFDGGVFPKVDLRKMADECGYNSIASANTAWCKLKKKLAAGASNATATADVEAKEDSPVKKISAAKGTKRGAPAATEGDEEATAEAEAEESPKKKRGGRKAKTDTDGDDAGVKAEDGEAAAGEESPKKKGRGRNAKAAAVTAGADGENGEVNGDANGETATAEPAKKRRGRQPKSKKVGTDVVSAADEKADAEAEMNGEAGGEVKEEPREDDEEATALATTEGGVPAVEGNAEEKANGDA